MDSNLPHFKFQSAEFINLADAEAVLDGVKVPLHSHVLSENSKVFAQLFSSLAEDGGSGTPSKPTSVTDLLTGESLDAILLLLLMFYHREVTHDVFADLTWGKENKYAPEHLGDPKKEVDTLILQSTVRLADKLDCRYIIEVVCRLSHCFAWTDSLGWLIEGRRLKLHSLTVSALVEEARGCVICDPTIVNTVSGHRVADMVRTAGVKSAHETLRDKRWLELDTCTLMLFMETKMVLDVKDTFGPGRPMGLSFLTDDILESYTPGDILCSVFPRETSNLASLNINDDQDGGEQQPLDALEELQEEQAVADFNEEWNDEDAEVLDD